MVKILVNSPDVGADLPPTLMVGSLETNDLGIKTEGDLVRQVFREHGPGSYNLFCRLDGDAVNRKVWKGEIQLEDRERLVYMAEENKLDVLASIVVPERPKTGVLKRVERPKKVRRQR